MIISGLQKLTLLDYPGYTACTVFTLGCNFRCLFCHNTPLVDQSASENYSEQEILNFLQTRKNKLDGVCISGGEPLLQPDILDFLKSIKSLGFLVKIDTNGSLPEKLEQILKNKLCDFVAMDIKNSLPKYNITCGVVVDCEKIKQSINLIIKSGISHEFRTTVVKELHESTDFVKIANLIKGANSYHLQCFKDSGNVLKQGLTAPTKQDLLSFKQVCIQNGLSNVNIRGID